MMHKDTQGIRRRCAGGLRPRLFALLGLVLLAGLVLSQCGTNGVGGSGGGALDDGASSTPTPFSADFIFAGGNHSCARQGDQAFCWGFGNSGRLGNGGSTDESSPVAVQGLRQVSTRTGVIEVSAGDAHTCALTSNNEAFCWGFNRFGQLGNGVSGVNVSGAYLRSPSPVAVRDVGGVSGSMLARVTAIAAGASHTCAVYSTASTTDQALCWGKGGAGQLGNGANMPSPSPVAVRGLLGQTNTLTGVTKISAGASHTCVVVSRQALCWGYNYTGPLGDGTNSDRNSPVSVLAVGGTAGSTAVLPDVEEISAGDAHTCAVVTSGEARCWGKNEHGQLGNGASGISVISLSPVRVLAVGQSMGGTPLTGVDAIAAGYEHTCAILVTSRQALCWGKNEYGQLGDGTMTGNAPSQTFHESPVAVMGVTGSMLTGVDMIAAGADHTCALQGGQALCWGRGASGRLGNGMTADKNIPVQVTTP